MPKKIITLAATACLLIFSLAACAESVSGGATASPVTNSTTLIGQVTKISGSDITIVTGTQGAPGKQPIDAGNSGGQTQQGSGQGGAAPSGAAPSGQPQNGQPGSGQAPGGFTASKETKTIKALSSTVVTINKSGSQTIGSVSDLAVDDIIKVTYNGDTRCCNRFRKPG